MRKDVRLGFAVGGILLAVIIVAVLFIHHNRNADKTVAFDPGNRVDATNDAAAPTDSLKPDGQALPSAGSPSGSDAQPAHADADGHSSADSAADKPGGRWDALFASTAQDPMKPQLTSNPPANSSKKETPIRHNAPAGASDGVANSHIETTPESSVANSPSKVDLITQAQDSTPRTHRVAAGETFVSIARMVYGDGRYYKAIEEANPTLTPEKLKPGIIIQLPPESQVKQAAAKSTKSDGASPAPSGPAVSSDGKTYTVQKDDSLYRISKKLYGKGDRSDEIYQLNKQTIGPDSTRLKIGMVLKLPEAVSSKASGKSN